jgi:hypothetical protein
MWSWKQRWKNARDFLPSFCMYRLLCDGSWSLASYYETGYVPKARDVGKGSGALSRSRGGRLTLGVVEGWMEGENWPRWWPIVAAPPYPHGRHEIGSAGTWRGIWDPRDNASPHPGSEDWTRPCHSRVHPVRGQTVPSAPHHPQIVTLSLRRGRQQLWEALAQSSRDAPGTR